VVATVTSLPLTRLLRDVSEALTIAERYLTALPRVGGLADEQVRADLAEMKAVRVRVNAFLANDGRGLR
jgi:hypothetical protein